MLRQNVNTKDEIVQHCECCQLPNGRWNRPDQSVAVRGPAREVMSSANEQSHENVPVIQYRQLPNRLRNRPDQLVVVNTPAWNKLVERRQRNHNQPNTYNNVSTVNCPSVSGIGPVNRLVKRALKKEERRVRESSSRFDTDSSTQKHTTK
jgi:hypothetical protein